MTTETPVRTFTTIPPEVVPLGVLSGHVTQVTRNRVVLVGAGGVGARIAPLLVKHMVPGDALTIIDHDLVEMKNIRRQHFTRMDVGRAKAEVVAERALAAAPVPGLLIDAVVKEVHDLSQVMAAQECCSPLWQQTPQGMTVQYTPTLLITAVDTLKCRQNFHASFLAGMHNGLDSAWIDCGNRGSGGQALLAGLINYAVQIPNETGWGHRHRVEGSQDVFRYTYVNWDGFKALAPSYLSQVDDPTEESCGLRVDPQTVMANTWAATAAMTIAVPFLECRPLAALGITFSAEFGSSVMAGVLAISHDARQNRGVFTPTRQLLA
jgi:hypothetical protein